MKTVVPHYIAKIEGHGSLRIDYSTDSAQMQIHEGERLFEAMLIGRNYEDGVFIPQRICGVCPTAHCLSAIKAFEYAFDIEVSKTTKDLRKLMLNGQMVQSHALHLFFLVVPDYLNVDSVLELADIAPEKFKLALRLKKIGDKMVSIVGGRPVHPITPVVGGFSAVPKREELIKLKNEIMDLLDDGIACVDLFNSVEYPELINPTQYLSIQSDRKYGFYGGKIVSSTGDMFDIADYRDNIKEIVKPYSNAKFAVTNDEGFMVGSLARLNLASEMLHPIAKKALKDSKIKFPSYNSFHNNFAQAVEILHFMEDAIRNIDAALDGDLKDFLTPFKVKAGVGSGAVEAPRGTLYYTLGVDDRGKITECNIITPTVQNLSNIEGDTNELLHITDGHKKEHREHLLEMLVRAYDPCITCSVH